MKNIIDQLKEALDVLKDYPGIEKVLDVEGAQDFLGKLEKVEPLIGIPNFSEVNQEKIDSIIALGNSSREEWVKALETLSPHISILDVNTNSPKEVIYSYFPLNLRELESDSGENKGNAVFFSGNEAEFYFDDNSLETFEGTWKEVFLKVVEYIKKNLTYPNVPEVE